MPIISTPYHEITCSGRIDNIRHPNCPSVSPGGFEQEDVVKRAIGLGWTEQGTKNYLCPGCSFVPADVPVEKIRTRQPRPQKAAPVEIEHVDQGQQ